MDTATVSTPARQSLGTRPAVTPTQSAKKDEDERRKRRTSGPRAVGTDAQQATPDSTKVRQSTYLFCAVLRAYEVDGTLFGFICAV